MRYNRLDLNLLVALDALLTEKKTTRAAERLNVSQSAVSGMLARLRAHFDDSLLVQVGRNMQRTPLGEELAEPVRQLLLQIESTVSRRPEFNPASEQRHVRITASDYAASWMVIGLIRKMQEIAPLMTVELMPINAFPADAVKSGLTDLMVIPEQLTHEDQPYERLPPDSYCCIAWTQNAKVGQSLDMAAFLECGHVATLFNMSRHPSLDEMFFRQHGIRRKIRVTTHDFESLAQIVVGTDLLAVMPGRLAAMCAQRYPIRIMAPPMAMPPLQLCMQWHRHHSNDPCHRWVRAQLAEIAAARL